MIEKREQTFYGRAYLYFAAAFLVTVAGFFPSYFNKMGETGAAHHFHGLTASLWMLLLVVQPLLYTRGRMRWHRRVGRLSFALVPLVVVGGLIMISIMLNSDNYPGHLAQQLAFIDFFVLTLFVVFYLLAVTHVNNTHYHARYMACTVFGPLIPALTRLLFWVPGISTFPASLNVSYLLVELVLLALLNDDRRRGRIRLPYPLMLGLTALQHLLMNFAGSWEWWRSLMAIYADLSPLF